MMEVSFVGQPPLTPHPESLLHQSPVAEAQTTPATEELLPMDDHAIQIAISIRSIQTQHPVQEALESGWL